jgi:flagellar FliJ protein
VPVRDAAAEAERQAALGLAEGQARLADAERRLGELQRYQHEYRLSLQQRTSHGIDATQLRAFHGFLARLDEALAQQELLVTRAREEAEALRVRWIDATRRVRVVGKVIERARSDERDAEERREQADLDERALRAHARSGALHAGSSGEDSNP